MALFAKKKGEEHSDNGLELSSLSLCLALLGPGNMINYIFIE